MVMMNLVEAYTNYVVWNTSQIYTSSIFPQKWKFVPWAKVGLRTVNSHGKFWGKFFFTYLPLEQEDPFGVNYKREYGRRGRKLCIKLRTEKLHSVSWSSTSDSRSATKKPKIPKTSFWSGQETQKPIYFSNI